MRTIKFRAWDKEQKIMQEWTYLKTWTPTDWEKSGIELMQFTGLKDRFDKEIYEGDLVQLKQKKYYNEGKPYVVKWKTLKLYNGWNVSRGTNLEVIGNLYENHELLK